MAADVTGATRPCVLCTVLVGCISLANGKFPQLQLAALPSQQQALRLFSSSCREGRVCTGVNLRAGC
jgi:hypothetical protein